MWTYIELISNSQEYPEKTLSEEYIVLYQILKHVKFLQIPSSPFQRETTVENNMFFSKK